MHAPPSCQPASLPAWAVASRCLCACLPAANPLVHLLPSTTGLLALPGVAHQDGGRTPGAALPMPRRPPHSGGGGVSRRATRQAAAQPVDNSLLFMDPEAAARHIRALKKQQQEAALAGSRQRQQQQLEEQEQAAEEMEQSPGAAQAVAAAVAADAAAAVLVESTKENLPDPLSAAAATATTPLADAIPALGTASKHSGKGTLTAVVQQHGGSRLRSEGDVQASGAATAAAHAGTAQPEQQPAAVGAAEGGDGQGKQQQEQAAAPAPTPAAAEEQEEPFPEYAPTLEDHARADRLQSALAQRTEGLPLDSLEGVHAKLARWAAGPGHPEGKPPLLKAATRIGGSLLLRCVLAVPQGLQ